MRNLALLVIGLGLAALPERAARAQYAATQDSTLRALRKVYVVFTDYENKVGEAVAQQLYSAATLELRKAGIRLAREQSELNMSQDGILNVTLITSGGGLSQYAVTLRIDVEQNAQLARTQQMLQMVTWFYEDRQVGVEKKELASAALTKGVNEFLSKWLAANGR